MGYEKRRALVALGLFLMLVSALAGCANDQKTINRVQPDLLDKSMFEGAWFVRQTVVDVPPTTGFSFVGNSGELEMIRWEIRENLLVGYRAYEKVPGADPDADHDNATVGNQPVLDGHGKGEDPTVYHDNPIVAYPITEHVDVRREYNAATGEQTNVISENTTDQPWNKRQFMRVDWTDPQVQNFSFLSSALTQSAITGSYWVDKTEKTPDAFRADKGEDGKVNYFDFTTRMFVNPEIIDQDVNDDEQPDQGAFPACWLLNTLSDCTSAEVAIRTSFLKVDEERELQYEPLVYDDQRQGEFGYFRTERLGYDRQYGVTYEGIQYLANRHDIWESAVDASGNVIPYAKRKLRPIVYALSENYPKDMLKVTEEIAQDCDKVFKRITAFARGQTEAQLEADLKAQTGQTCMYCLDKNEDNHARIGDLRYNFLYWVDGNQVASPLGYGPSVAHPETGRIISGTAYVYGAAVDRYAQTSTDMIRLLNGDLTDEDLISGVDVGRQVRERRPAIDPRTMERLATTAIRDKNHSILGEKVFTRLQEIREKGFSKTPSPSSDQIYSIAHEAGLTDVLVTPEMRQDYAAERGLPNADKMAGSELERLSQLVVNPLGALKQQQAVRAEAERRSITLADYSDPALLGLADEVQKKGLEGKALYQYLREAIYRGVMLHELGHTFGLRHNFGASTDALNFFPEYWPLREKTLQPTGGTDPALNLLRSNCAVQDAGNQAACEAQLKGKIREYQYASIMDYGARFNSDVHGYGSYDVAALASAYGDAVEVFDPSMVRGLSPAAIDALKIAGNIRSPLFGQLGERVHYAQLPALFGGSANMQKRVWVPRAAYERNKTALRVPYVACFDEYRDRVWFCHTWDQGADPYEIADFYIDSYEDDYYFNNFARGRVGFGPFAVYQRTLERYFLPLTFAYQNALFDLFEGTGDESYQRLAEATMSAALTELWSVLSRPNYGSFAKSDGEYRRVSYTPDLSQYTIRPGEGRSTWSRYDLDSGYNLYTRVIESGHLYEQMAAIGALTSNDASRLGIGRDVVGGDLQYSIPFYLIFDNELTQLFGSMFVGDVNGFGPRVDANGKLIPSALAATQADGKLVGTPVDPEVPWTIRVQSAIMGFAWFRTNFNLDYSRRSEVVLEGTGEEFTPAPNYETVRYADPISGRVYLAYRDPLDTGRWPGAEKLETLNGLAANLQKALDDLAKMPQTTEQEKAAYAAQLQIVERRRVDISNNVEDVDMMRQLYSLFGRSPFKDDD